MSKRLGMTEEELNMLSTELLDIASRFREIREKYKLNAMTLSSNQYSLYLMVHEDINKDDIAITLTEVTYDADSIAIKEPVYFNNESNVINPEQSQIKNDIDLLEHIDDYTVEEVREYCKEKKIALKISNGALEGIEHEEEKN